MAGGRLENTALERRDGGSAVGCTGAEALAAGAACSPLRALRLSGCSLSPTPTTRSLRHSLELQSHPGLVAKENSLRPKPGVGFFQAGGGPAAPEHRCPLGTGTRGGCGGFARRRGPVPPQLTRFTVLPVLSELLKTSAWFLLSLTRLIMFAQPPCRLCSPGELAGRQRNSAGSVSVCFGAAVEASLLVACSHPFS